MSILTAEQVDTRLAAGFDPTHPADRVPHELRTIIEAAITNAPRSLQTTIGPSELGMSCVRCLAHKLAGTTEATEAAWLPTIGTAVHGWLEEVFATHEHTREALGMRPRFLIENRVAVGRINGIEITGSTDLFDTHTGTVIDWKVVGTTTLRKVKGNGASSQYATQAHLYGKGWEDGGFTVRHVLIYFLPRNAVSLADAVPWTVPYDRAVAEQALARAEQLLVSISTVGLDATLAGLPTHDGDGFTCRRYPDYTPPAVAAMNPADPFGG